MRLLVSMAFKQASAASERSSTSSIKVGFWNLGWLETRLSGKNREYHLHKLRDIAKLWRKHDLDMIMLCEMGEHGIGLSIDSRATIEARIMDNIRGCSRFTKRGHEQYEKATEPVLRSSWHASYFTVWDERRLIIEVPPFPRYFRNDNYRHYVSIVVRKPCSLVRRQFQSVLLVNAHAPDGKHRLGDQTRRDIITSFRAEASRLTEGRVICGGDLNTDPAMISRYHPDLQVVRSRPVPLKRGDCACVGGLTAFQTDSMFGRSYQLDESVSDAHDAVVVEATTVDCGWNVLDGSKIGHLMPTIASFASSHTPDALPTKTILQQSPSRCSPMDPTAGDIPQVNAAEGCSQSSADEWVGNTTLPTGAIEPTIGDTSHVNVNEIAEAIKRREEESKQRETEGDAKQRDLKQKQLSAARAIVQADATEHGGQTHNESTPDVTAVETATRSRADTERIQRHRPGECVMNTTLPAAAIEPTMGDTSDVAAITSRQNEAQQRNTSAIEHIRATLLQDKQSKTKRPLPYLSRVPTIPEETPVLHWEEPTRKTSWEETTVIDGGRPAETPPLSRSHTDPEITPVKATTLNDIPNVSPPVSILYNFNGDIQYIFHPMASPCTIYRPDEKSGWMWIHGTLQPISEAAQNRLREFYESTQSNNRHDPPFLKLYDHTGDVEYLIHPIGGFVTRADDPRQVQSIHGAIEPISQAARIKCRAFYDANLSLSDGNSEVVADGANNLSVQLEAQTNGTYNKTPDGEASLATIENSDPSVDLEGVISVTCVNDTAFVDVGDRPSSDRSPDDVTDHTGTHPNSTEEMDANEVCDGLAMTLDQNLQCEVTKATALDGESYTHSEFIQYYGPDEGPEIWLTALHTQEAHPKFFEELDAKEVFGGPPMTRAQILPRDVIMAIALDGESYTQSEFIEYYGPDEGQEIWLTARHVQEDIWLLAQQLTRQAHYLSLRAHEHDSFEQAVRGVCSWWSKDREPGEDAFSRLNRRLREPLWWRAMTLKRLTGDMTSVMPLTGQQCDNIWQQWRTAFARHGLHEHQKDHTEKQIRSLHGLTVHKHTGCIHVAKAIIKFGARGDKSINDIIIMVYDKKKREDRARTTRESHRGYSQDNGRRFRHARRIYHIASARFWEAYKLKSQPLQQLTYSQNQLLVLYDNDSLHRDLHRAKTLLEEYRPKSSDLLCNIVG